jgi:hypothetical protein
LGWSEPVNVGAPVNSAFDEIGATLSPNQLSLYFHSNRTDLPGAQGGNDIWVSKRACRRCPWQTPVNLGPPINSPLNDGGVNFTNDGKVMFFNSTRTGGFGRNDIYVSHRHDPRDDFGWEPPVNLGPDVNTPDSEERAGFLAANRTLFFARGQNPLQLADIYVARVTRKGKTFGPAVAVTELNHPTLNDGGLTIRRDGKEIIFWSNRESPQGDLFVSTRQRLRDAWSVPVRLPAVNTEFSEIAATLSFDGRSLLITSNRPGGLGGAPIGSDIWISTRLACKRWAHSEHTRCRSH